MFTGQERCRALAVQAVVCLLVVVLSINLLMVQMASGEDAMVDNRSGVPDDGRNARHEGRLSPDRSIPDLLRQKVEEERGGILGQGADVHFSIDGSGKKVGEYEPKAPNHPLSKETITGKRSEGANTGLLT